MNCHRKSGIVRIGEEVLGLSKYSLYRKLRAGEVTLDDIREETARYRDANLVKVSQAAGLAGVNINTVYRWIYEGRLEEVRLFGSIVRVRADDLTKVVG